MISRFSALLAALCVLSITLLPAARAQNPQIGTSGTVDSTSLADFDSFTLQQFTVGSSAFEIASINATVARFGASSTGFALLYNDNSDSVGNILASSLGTTISNGDLQSLTFFFSPNLFLEANTNYWVAITSTGNTDWAYSDNAVNTGVNGTANDLYTFTTDGGATFEAPTTGGFGDDFQLFQINAVPAATPEPGTFVLVAVGLFAVGVRRCRR